jgi:hypothetical protein
MPPITRPPVSPIAPMQARNDAPANTPAAVTVISRDRRFTVTASKAPALQEPQGNRPPADMAAHLAQSLGLDPMFGMKKQPRVYTLQPSADEEPGPTPATPGSP